MRILQGWLAKAKKISGPTPLPEEPRSEQMEKLLVVVPYKASIKKGKKEVPEAREGLRHEVHPGNWSGDAATSSVQEGDEDEEESTSSHSKKRAESSDVEEVQPPQARKGRCRPKLVLFDSSDSNKESEASETVSEKDPRVKPPAARYAPRRLQLVYAFSSP
jgi:hypothetical protein